jgi:molecular chaperone HtpG
MVTGNINVQAENIFPIIKKFLYSDQEIFLRELVSNAVDATTKLQTLAKRGEVGEVADTTIQIKVDTDAKTLTISDKGIGLTAEEAQKYLSEVAFSGASEFLEKYQEGNIIGHFGLGFYSAFMVASKVEVVSKSYKKDAPAIRWTCEGSPQYSLEETEKAERGTDVILHISADGEDFLSEYKIEDLLTKYCKFLPVEIQFGTESHEEGEGDDKTTVETPKIINNTRPAWKRAPSELNDEDYRNFYRELYPLSNPPIFWIHLNIDYPFNLTGVLYFPKITNAIEAQKNKVQLYCNQVFVTDEVKEILPEFLTLLHGVIDSPDIPLNVSRSYLQSDREVKKITQYITKKVADKLDELFRKDREDFQTKWTDTGVFVKYGIVSDQNFADRAKGFTLLRNTEGGYFTVEEYLEKVKANQTDKHNKVVCIYTTSPAAHDAQIQAAKARGYDVLEMDTLIDTHFMQHLEYKDGQNLVFVRVDSATADQLVQKEGEIESVLSETDKEKVKTVFSTFTAGNNTKYDVEIAALSTDDAPVQITRNEFMRRMAEMQQFQNMGGGFGFPETYNVVVNSNHPLVATKLLTINDQAEQTDFAKHLFDLARVGQGMLSGAELTAFVKRSLTLMN